ncbi:HNH endonuclease signature motif containing protein [Nocardioides iriomotensis]|uniref:HNH endonuclease n=1 Tax=Nocardioides iriomotensis TaxID=715784 RepID=A0A4V1Z2E7_9ACTN|nr:HNH endonuclease signature motif containing protein [Nocardioides iriomotensis]RYU14146.1 HNH endonuclease [Nocardioides iriomotensis]
MAEIPAPEQADTPAAVLAAVRAEREAADRAECRVLELAQDWAAMHAPDGLDPLGMERSTLVAGPGTPPVGEFCVAELASALRISTDAGRTLLAEAVELAHRLPQTWRRVRAGELPAWRARRVARSTLALTREGAAFVDRHVASFAHKVGPAQLDRLVEEALVRFEPDLADARRRAAADGRHVTVHTDQVGYDGTVHVEGDLDLADALDLDAALITGAARLADLGCTDSLDVRRAHTLGELARGTDPTLDLDQPGHGREVVLHVHITPDALNGHDGTHLARVDNTRSFVDADQVRTWCGTPGTTVTVRPVLDLDEHISSTAYETPDRLAEQATHVDGTCVFPWCTRPARSTHGTDCDHVVPHAEGGTTCSCNIARLCRRHHRLKTHTAWHYDVLERGSYLWTSPHGLGFLRDRTGTIDVTPPDRPSGRHAGHLLVVSDP